MLQRSRNKYYKMLGVDDLSDDEINEFCREYPEYAEFCVNVCCTCQYATNFGVGIRSQYNNDALLPFSEYGKLTNMSGKKLSQAYARNKLDIEVVTIGTFQQESQGKTVEAAIQQMIFKSAGKGVDGRDIPMPAECPAVNMKLSMVNSNPGMGKDGLTVQDPEKPVYFVNIAFAKNVIGNKEIQNSDSWRDPTQVLRDFKFQRPDEDMVEKVKGCVRAAQLECLDEFRD